MTEHAFPSNLTKGREIAGLTQRQLASRVGAAASSICRWESGKSTPRRDTVQRLDDVLQLRGRLMRVWELDTSGTALAPWMRDIERLEERAESIELVSALMVPGPLQSPQYARMVFEEGLAGTDREIERLVAHRCGRYEYLRAKNNPTITAIFPVTALSWTPAAVKREQAAHLLSLTATGKVRVNLVPEGTLLTGVTSPFIVFHLADGEKVASSDHVAGNVLHDDSTGYDRLHGLVKRALECALPARQSSRTLGDLL
ncbi:Scr1 family TA system antitoxin-like transcriptional regulator [Nocardiopsis sp. NPDC050513]|uniref:helix-turn-helix domain-containing protein n=1 Tax=Nocardiopsis sp. NPDC050513 TaxID=3364338 RepID=UPI00379E5907